MTLESVMAQMLPTIAGPVSVAVVGYWLKGQLRKVDQIATIVLEMHHIKEKLIELKVELEKLNQAREDFIILRSEVKTQWRKMDELENRMRGLHGS